MEAMFKVFKTVGIESIYSVSTNPLFSCDGWTIYPLKHKTTKKQCSVWIFDKKKFENALTKLGILNRSNKQVILDDCFQVLRNYVSSLVKLKHPSILQVLEPYEDHKSRALFVTEYVVSNLVKIDKNELDEIMITKGLLQVSNGVKFIHESLHSVHLNIQPSTIFINENFDWKLSGLNFLRNVESGSGEIDTFDPRMPGFVNINFRFSSPDLILNRKLNYEHDLFSIGCLIYFLFNSKNLNVSTPYLISCENNNITEYERDVKKLENSLNGGNSTLFRNIPENYINSLRILLNYKLTQWDINQFIQSDIFNNELIKILDFFDSFVSQDIQEQYKYLTKFKNHAMEFSKMLLLNKFLPILCDLLDTYTKDPKKKVSTEEESMVSVILDSVFIISQSLSQLTFLEKIFPRLNQIILSLGLNSCKVIVINNLSLIENKLGINESNSKNYDNFSKFLLTLFKNGIVTTEVGQQQLMFQERILTNLKIFINFQNYNTISSVIFPDICSLFTKTTSLKIKNLTVRSFVVLLKSEKNTLDNYTITEKLLPILHNTSSKNFDNAEFLRNIILLYEEIFTKLSSKHEAANLEIILEQVFFQLWKLFKYTKTVSLNNYLISTTKRIETYLISKASENLTADDDSVNDLSRQTSLAPVTQSTTSLPQQQQQQQYQAVQKTSSERQHFQQDETSAPSATPASRLQLKPTSTQRSGLSFGATSSKGRYQPINKPKMNTIQPSKPAQVIRPVQPMQLTPVVQPLQPMQPQSNNTIQPMQSQSNSTIQPMHSQSNNTIQMHQLQPTQIDWSVNSAPRSQLQTPVNNIINNNNNTNNFNGGNINFNSTQPQSQQASLPPGFSMGIIQPIKKPLQASQSSQMSGAGWSDGDSLI